MMDSFANNVAFVLLSCGKIGMMVNEKLTLIPGCGDRMWCPYETFKAIFDIANCDLDVICDNHDTDEFSDIQDDRV